MSTRKALDILKTITIGGKDIVSAGFLGSISVEGDKAEVVLLLPDSFKGQADSLKTAVEKRLIEAGFKPDVRYRIRESKPSLRVNVGPVGQMKKRIPGVKKVIAVASGKGGVGKSTVAVNLAVALSKRGLKSGLFDADVYGPSVSVLMGLDGERVYVTPEKRFKPIEKYGIEVMTFGVLVKEDTPILWRGAMLHKAYEELLMQTAWGDLDVLVVDLPPGTGDSHLSLAQGYYSGYDAPDRSRGGRTPGGKGVQQAGGSRSGDSGEHGLLRMSRKWEEVSHLRRGWNGQTL